MNRHTEALRKQSSVWPNFCFDRSDAANLREFCRGFVEVIATRPGKRMGDVRIDIHFKRVFFAKSLLDFLLRFRRTKLIEMSDV